MPLKHRGSMRSSDENLRRLVVSEPDVAEG